MTAGITAAIANDPPPRIAFVANGIVPADALAAGPIAGQLGAPIYTTQPDSLSPAAATGLDDFGPALVIVLGGPVAIHDTVIDQIEDATGLTETSEATPAGGIVRAAGGDRFDTAAAVADLLNAYNPAYLPTDMKAIDSDKLDGKDSSAFQPAGDYLGETATAANADKLDGKDSTAFLDVGSLRTVHGGVNWLAHGSGPTAVTRLVTGTSVSGDGNMNIGVDAPVAIGSTNYGLSSLELCYQTSGGGQIDAVQVYNAIHTSVFTSSAVRTHTDPFGYKCDILTIDAPVVDGIGVVVGTSGGGSVRLGPVKANWTPSAAESAAAATVEAERLGPSVR